MFHQYPLKHLDVRFQCLLLNLYLVLSKSCALFFLNPLPYCLSFSRLSFSDIAFFTSLIFVISCMQCSCSGVGMLKYCVGNNHVTYCTELKQLQPNDIGMAKSNFTYSYESISDPSSVQRE